MEDARLSKLFSQHSPSAREWTDQRAIALAEHAVPVASAYLTAVAFAEVLLIFVSPVLGLACHGILLLALLTHYSLLTYAADRDRLGRVGGIGLPPQAEVFRRALPALVLLPLARILSLVMPVHAAPPLAWYVLVGAPLLLACLLAMRALGVGPGSLGMGFAKPQAQALIGLTGVPLAVLAYLVIRPRPLIAHPTWEAVLGAALVLVVFSALVEELLFRGLLQAAAISVFGPTGITWGAVVFAFYYLATLSPTYVLIMFCAGLFYGWSVSRTGSLWGVIVSHGLINVGALLLLPLVWK